MELMQYVYVFLWAALAVMTVIVARKEGLLAAVMAAFFVFMTVWYGIRAFAGINMFGGALGIVFKCVLGAFAAALAVIWIIKRKSGR
jgi:hypothetical protein